MVRRWERKWRLLARLLHSSVYLCVCLVLICLFILFILSILSHRQKSFFLGIIFPFFLLKEKEKPKPPFILICLLPHSSFLLCLGQLCIWNWKSYVVNKTFFSYFNGENLIWKFFTLLLIRLLYLNIVKIWAYFQ